MQCREDENVSIVSLINQSHSVDATWCPKLKIYNNNKKRNKQGHKTMNKVVKFTFFRNYSFPRWSYRFSRYCEIIFDRETASSRSSTASWLLQYLCRRLVASRLSVVRASTTALHVLLILHDSWPASQPTRRYSFPRGLLTRASSPYAKETQHSPTFDARRHCCTRPVKWTPLPPSSPPTSPPPTSPPLPPPPPRPLPPPSSIATDEIRTIALSPSWTIKVCLINRWVTLLNDKKSFDLLFSCKTSR